MLLIDPELRVPYNFTDTPDRELGELDARIPVFHTYLDFREYAQERVCCAAVMDLRVAAGCTGRARDCTFAQ
jgi:hypothetical protein